MGGAKECSTGVLDTIFGYLYASTMRFHVTTSSSPTALASNTSGAYLVGATEPSFPTSDYLTIGSSGNNRYCTIAACSCDIVRATTTAACVVWFNPTCSEAMYVTTCTTQDLTAANKCNIGTWTITVNQPT